MKRRLFMRTLAATPAVPALLAQQAVPLEAPVSLEVTTPEAIGEPIPHFFTPTQFAALKKLGDLLMPAMGETPGASACHAPEFLDFLISQSPVDRQQLYRNGLDALNAQALQRYKKPFADAASAPADDLLAPLRDPWTYDPPLDSLAKFLRQAKQDFRTATLNSREYNIGPRQAAAGLYWHPLDDI